MMQALETSLALAINLFFAPLLLMGIVKKVKARMQMRVGAPILQPFYDAAKLLRKSETISSTSSWVFAWSPKVAFAIALYVAIVVPWSGVILPSQWAPASNFVLVLYLLALGRFMAMLAALDTGSAFGGLGASREATISILVEPTLLLAFGGLAVHSGSMDLQTVFAHRNQPAAALLAGLALLLASLAELCRMPVDDPTTHLELTMVHEALVLENSGPSLALVEYAAALRHCVFFGFSAQMFLQVMPSAMALPMLIRLSLGLAATFAIGCLVAVMEGVTVKLKWRSIPNFLAFAAVAGFLSALAAVASAPGVAGP